MTSKSRILLLAVAGLCTVIPLPSGAATTTFNPQLGLSRVYTSNPLFTSSEEAPSDSYTALTLSLPVRRTTPRSTTQFLYSPSYQAYDSLDGLDNLSHALLLLVDATPTEASQVNFSTSYYEGQDQGPPSSVSGPEPVLTPRNSREQGRLDLGFRSRLAGKWNWAAKTYFEAMNFSAVDNEGQVPGSYVPQNRTSVGVTGRIDKLMSARTIAGIEVRLDQFDLDVSGKEDVQRLGLVVTHDFSRRDQLDFGLGGYRSEFDRGPALEPGQEDTKTGFYGHFDFARQYSKFELRLFGSHEPTFGYDFVGTSTNTIAGISLDREFSAKIATDVSVRYSRAESSFGGDLTTENIGVGASLSYRPFRTLSLKFSGWLSDQTSSGGVDGSTAGDIAVFEGIVGLVWSPFAAKPIAGGGGPLPTPEDREPNPGEPD